MVGDCVTLEASNADSNWTTVISHVGVDSVDSSADFMVLLALKTLSADTSGISTDFSDSDATLRKSIKVGAIATGAGSIFVQQVQITGVMKLIREEIESVEFIVESKGGKKQLYIEGVFLQGNIKNRNGRMYPMETLRREVGRYNENHVQAGRALGELGHPDSLPST